MKTILLCCALLSSLSAFAEDAGLVAVSVADAGFTVSATAPEDAGVLHSTKVDAGVPVVLPVPSLDDPFASMAGFYEAVMTGNGWLAAMFLLFFFVGFLRTAGKRLHDMIPDDTNNKILKPLESVLYFIFDTKIGGWGLNWLSAIGGCLAAATLAGHVVDANAWKVALLASTGGTALVELKDDIMGWWTKRNVVKAAEAAAKVAAVAPMSSIPVPAIPDPAATPKP